MYMTEYCAFSLIGRFRLLNVACRDVSHHGCPHWLLMSLATYGVVPWCKVVLLRSPFSVLNNSTSIAQKITKQKVQTLATSLQWLDCCMIGVWFSAKAPLTCACQRPKLVYELWAATRDSWVNQPVWWQHSVVLCTSVSVWLAGQFCDK